MGGMKHGEKNMEEENMDEEIMEVGYMPCFKEKIKEKKKLMTIN